MSYRIIQLLLILGDFICLYFSLYIAVFVRNSNLAQKALTDLSLPMYILFFLAIIILYIAGAYDIIRAKNSWEFFQRIILSALVWMAAGVVFFYFQNFKYITPKTILALTALSGFGLIAIWRFINHKFLSKVILKTNIIFAGITKETVELMEIIKKTPQLGYQILGIIETNSSNPLLAAVTNVSIVETLANIKNKYPEQPIHLIVISPSQNTNQNLLKELYNDLFKQIEVVEEIDFFESITGRIPPSTFSESWFLANFHEQRKKTYDRVKILIDYLVAGIMSIFVIATFPLIALIIKINSKGPIFYKQERVGRNGQIFKVYKYRTMQALQADGSAETEGPRWAADKDQRITAVGKFLRRTRLDEIPQFFNILRGEMSLIGPRPERPEFVRQLTEKMPFYDLRHLIKPGLAGWAQLRKSYYGTMDENLYKLEYDLYYIKNRGPILDIIILLRTVNVLLRMIGR